MQMILFVPNPCPAVDVIGSLPLKATLSLHVLDIFKKRRPFF